MLNFGMIVPYPWLYQPLSLNLDNNKKQFSVFFANQMNAFYINCKHEYQHLLQCLDSKDPVTLPIHTGPSNFQQIRVFYPVFPVTGEQHVAHQ